MTLAGLFAKSPEEAPEVEPWNLEERMIGIKEENEESRNPKSNQTLAVDEIIRKLGELGIKSTYREGMLDTYVMILGSEVQQYTSDYYFEPFSQIWFAVDDNGKAKNPGKVVYVNPKYFFGIRLPLLFVTGKYQHSRNKFSVDGSPVNINEFVAIVEKS